MTGIVAGLSTIGNGFAALAPAALPAADVDVGGELLRVLLSLVAVVALIFVAGWLSRRLQARSRPGGRRIRCVETMAVGARDRVLLLDADGKRLLVGVGPGGMRTLHVYEGAAPVEADPPALPAVPDIAQLLSRWKGKS
ncbi:flagellar biosynthetic protein FliO [Rhodanobacter sp. DHB23]|uniref:flagellar biosynthetic protein FliO n=1 Tax=Rhodanobacter sp. DHB23 TaxID=2775923 RepID=UPI0031BB6DDD